MSAEKNILLLFWWLDEVYSIHGEKWLPSSIYVFYHYKGKNENQSINYLVNAAIEMLFTVIL
jgi:hypothetical protein